MVDLRGENWILAMDQLGTSFDNLCKRCAKQFSLTTVLVTGDQMQGIIEWVHLCDVLHRDIKPQNFLVGRGQFRNTIYLIDFGRPAPISTSASRNTKFIRTNTKFIHTSTQLTRTNTESTGRNR
jgi:serine/threonine protein kinase